MVGQGCILKKPKNLNIMVVRIRANGSLANARPCYQCTLMLKSIGINKVYYSVDNNIICEKVADMISINSSSVWKKTDRIQYNKPKDILEYYRSIFLRMPNEIKKKNAEFFVQNIFMELDGCNYKFTKTTLSVYVYNDIIGIINLI